MKESYVEGIACHNGPESCGDGREVIFEALTGVRAGRVLSREITPLRDADAVWRCGRQHPGAPPSQGATGSRVVLDPVHARKHLAREPGDPMFAGPDGRSGRVGKSKDTRR